MEVITIESKAYKELIDKIEQIASFVSTISDTETTDDAWVDSYEVCTFLRISERTLQRLRSNGIISYSIISGKTYYTIGEVKRLLQERLIKATDEQLKDLVEGHREHFQRRAKNKPKG